MYNLVPGFFIQKTGCSCCWNKQSFKYIIRYF
jgi:hypothetical protein